MSASSGGIVVIGAGGFIGRRLTQLLRARHVVSISSADAYFDERGLIADDLDVRGSIDAVVYLSQSPKYQDVPAHAGHLWAVNVVSAIKAAEWARRRGARRFVYASSGTVYAPSFAAHRETDVLRRDNWYALSKVHAEEALQRFTPDLDVTCARLFSVYGPGQRGKLVPNLVSSIDAGVPVFIQPHPLDSNDREGMRLSLVHVDDAAAAVVRLIDRPGPPAINVASPDTLTIRQIATAVGACLGKDPVFEPADEPRDGDVIADISAISRLLDDRFVSFDAAIRDVVRQSGADR
jgi:UDP-glucose 4-epimerase